MAERVFLLPALEEAGFEVLEDIARKGIIQLVGWNSVDGEVFAKVYLLCERLEKESSQLSSDRLSRKYYF